MIKDADPELNRLLWEEEEMESLSSYPAPDPETAFDQYVAAYRAGGDYTHLHPCVQQAIDDVYGEGAGNTNYLAPRAFTRHYDDYWHKVWLSNIGGRHAISERFPMIPSTWETRERRSDLTNDR